MLFARRGVGLAGELRNIMQGLSRAVLAAALLGCAVPKALAENDTHWLTDAKSNCALFDGNAQAGDTVAWSGDCTNGLASGQGTATFSRDGAVVESVTAEFAKGVAPDGHIVAHWGAGWSYDGDTLHGQFNGAGVLINDSHDRFDGNWTNGKMNGQGVLTRANGETYDGAWKDDQPNGPGVLTRPDGTRVEGSFLDGKLAPANTIARTDVEPDSAQPKPAEATSPAPDAFASLSGKALLGVDGSSIALTRIDGGIERQITDAGATPKKTTFTFMTDRMGTVVEDGVTTVTGFFRLTDAGLEVRYADGRSENLSANGGGGILLTLEAAGQTSCRNWYPQDHVFSEADKKAALAAYASKLGLQPPHADCAVSAPAPQARIAPKSRPGKHAEIAKPSRVAFNTSGAMPRKLGSLQSVAVKDSVVHAIDGGAPVIAGPVLTAGVPGMASNVDAKDGSHCLKVESDGQDWGFRNGCGFAVQFAYCLMHTAEKRTDCDSGGVTGSVAANGFGALSADNSLSEKDADHDFRWIACAGGAGEVAARLAQIDPPAGHCDRTVTAAK